MLIGDKNGSNRRRQTAFVLPVKLLRNENMKTLFLSCFLAVLSCTAILGTPCAPGSLDTFVNFGATGCQIGTVEFTNFTILPGLTIGTPVDPAQVQITPGGTALNPMLSFTLNKTANAGEVFESFFRFSASDFLTGASIDLTSPTATGDAAITAILDVCPNGSFSGSAPFGCPTSPASLTAFAINQSSLLSDSASFAVAKSADVFVDLTLDGGQSGTATFSSASIGFSSVPEPSTALLLTLGLSAFGVVLQARRRMVSGKGTRRYSRVTRGDVSRLRG